MRLHNPFKNPSLTPGPSRQARSRDPSRCQIILMLSPTTIVSNSPVLSTSHHMAAPSPLGLPSNHRSKPAGLLRLPSALPAPRAVHGSAGPPRPGQWVAAPLTLRQSRPFLQRLVGNSGYGHRLPVRHLRRLASAAGTGALFTPASPGWAPTWTWRNNPGGTAAFFPVSGPSFAASPRMAAGRCQWQRRQWQRRQWQGCRRHRQRSFTAPRPS